jgi:hypothetical protein
MKPPRLTALFLFVAAGAAVAAESPPAAVEGVQGVRQEGAARVRNVDPRTARPVSPDKAEGVEQAATAVNPVQAPGTVAAPTPPPPPQGGEQAATAVKPVSQSGTASAPPPPPPPKGVDQGATTARPVAGPGTASTPPPPPPPKGVDQGATAVKPATGPGTPAPVPPPAAKGVGAVEGVKTPGSAGIHAVQGIAGIDTDKLRNLEAALQAKPAAHGEGPKAKAAAQLLQKPGNTPKPPEEKSDGRSDFQERIPDKGS